MGIFKGYINGQEIDDDILLPGWTNYKKRVDFYQFETSVLESLSITSEETLKSISDKLQEVFLQTNK